MTVRIPFPVDPAAVQTSFRLSGLMLVAVAAGLLSACSTGPSAGAGAANGSHSNSGGSQPASSEGGSQPASSGGVSVADGLGHPVNVCALLPAATVASITGEPITQTEEQDTAGVKDYMCNYTSTDGTSGLTIDVLAQGAAIGYDAVIQASDAVVKGHEITGLGDKAYSNRVSGFEALFGNVSISVSNLSSDSAAETLIRTLQPKI